MTSTRQIKKRMLRDRRYADHYRAPGLRVGRRGILRRLDRERALAVRRIRKRRDEQRRRIALATRRASAAIRRFVDAVHMVNRGLVSMRRAQQAGYAVAR